MASSNFDPTGEKKARKQATVKGAIICAVFNAIWGALLGVIILATIAPAEYKAKPDAKTGIVPPPPAGLFYWPGTPNGNYQTKEAQFLAGPTGGVTVSDGELNSWADVLFKSDVGKPAAKPAPLVPITNLSDIDVAKAKAAAAAAVEVAATDIQTYGIEAGTPNFHAFKDPQAPAEVPVSFQIAVPIDITLSGIKFGTIYQARGVFVAGPSGPQFKPYYSFIGHTRIPVLPGLAQEIFNKIAAKYASSDAVKKQAGAWARLSGVSVQDGALVLGGK
jgi:hypothetical protein